MRRIIILLGSALFLAYQFSWGLDLNRARFTEVVNEVNVIPSGSGPKKQAEVNDLFKVPDILQTGSRSRAELRADDETITRVGANTIFSFEPAGRTIRLRKGSILFHSPKGRGGGTIKTGAATASVLGTTITVVATEDGGFKLLVQEGKAQVKLPNGLSQVVNAGELVFILPKVERISSPIPFDLERQAENSKLLQGFSKPIASREKIDRAITQQNRLVKGGRAKKTSLLIASMDQQENVQLIDNNTLDQAGGNVSEGTVVPAEVASTLNGLDDKEQQKELTAYYFGSDAEIQTPILEQARVVNMKNVPNLIHNWLRGMGNVPFVFGRISKKRFAHISKNLLISAEDIDVNAFVDSREERGLRQKNLRSFMSKRSSDKLSFFFLAEGNVTFEDLVSFKNAPLALGVIADGKIQAKEGTTIEVKASDFNGFYLVSSGMQQYDHTTIKGAEVVDMHSDDVICIMASQFQSKQALNLRGDSIQTYGDRVTAGGPNERNIFTSEHINMYARNDIYLNSAILNANQIMMSARTVALQDVSFSAGSSVVLSSANGKLAPNPNTGQAVVPGDVNFINNVLYGNEPAEFAVGNQIKIQKRDF
ncbi:MAG: FecR family protein [Verrucomicrobiae bacterium]|nr:FecR family protein [Verrucomicrobiae bacterium]